ncbi:MAG: hypothetical protein AB1391_01900 [Candidatus Micrarchaeota archaeon]
MSAYEILHLIELNKKKAELDFKKGYLIIKGNDKNDEQINIFNNELTEILYQISALEKKLQKKHISLFYPNEDELIKLGSELEKFSPAEIYSAIEKKNGIAYELFEKRGKIIKENFEKRGEIAALIEFANSLHQNIRIKLIKEIKSGEFKELDINALNEKERLKLFTLLNRSGITCFLDKHLLTSESTAESIKWNEIKIQLNGRYLWIDQEKEDEIKQFEKELTKVSNLVQIKNAERQIKAFTPEEETQFKDLQVAYLAMIKKRDAFFEEK